MLINFGEQISPKLQLLEFKNFVLASLFILFLALNVISGQSLKGVCLIPNCTESSFLNCTRGT